MSRQLGSRYVLDDVIGKGASGQVWRGHDTDGHMFAFKVLRDSIADDPDSVARFFQERKILLSLQHPNVVQVHDLVAEGDTLALVMELVTGGDLRGYLKARGALTPDEACELTASIADGLAFMHQAGIIHRDIKPENILIDTSSGTPVPKITDFSIARIVSTAKQSTMMAGTPSYVAPELFDDSPPTVQSDLYSLGIVLYELIAGVPPFRSDSLLSMMKLHATEPPPRPPGIPDSVWDIIEKLLAKEFYMRPTDAEFTGRILRNPTTVPQAEATIRRPHETLKRPVTTAEVGHRADFASPAHHTQGVTHAPAGSEQVDHSGGGSANKGPMQKSSRGGLSHGTKRGLLVVAGVTALVAVLTLTIFQVRRSSTPQIVFADLGLSGVGADSQKFKDLIGSGNSTDPAWSPNGEQIAVSRYTVRNKQQIYIVNADGTGLKQLTTIGHTAAPSWSPDGSRIAFTSDDGLYVVNKDGTGLKMLTGRADGGKASWSPDGTRIVFGDFSGNGNHDNGIYVIDTDGTDRRRLTDGGGTVASPDWSPNGTQIVFDADDSIYVINADGNGLRRLAKTAGTTEAPLWSPNGTRVVFGVLLANQCEIEVIDVEDADRRKLPTHGCASDPGWSPDGDQIVFSDGPDDQHPRISVVNANGTGLKDLGVEGLQPVWSPSR